MASSLDFMSPQQPVDFGSRTSTATVPPPTAPSAPPSVANSATPNMSKVTEKSVSLPFSPVPAQSPVYTSSAGQAKKNQVRKQANDLATSLSIPKPSAPSPTQQAQPPSTPPSPQNPLQPQIDAEKQANEAAKAASMATPGTIQLGKDGFQAATGAGDAQNKAFLDLQAKRSQDASQTTQNVQGMNAAASAAGVSATYQTFKDPKTGIETGYWVNSTTGQPQIPPSTEPVREDPKWGQVQGDVILRGQYFGLTTGQAEAIEKAGSDVKDQYETAIGKQTEQARQDEANALIRGGQAGGFLSSQISGQAATQSIGGTWAGAGGTLKRLQDEYDQSIAKMKEDEAEAVNQAKDYALTAARTGNAQYYDAANAAARQIDEIRTNQQQTLQQQAADRKTLSDIQKLDRADATETISNLVANGYTDLSKLPKAYLDDLDKHLQAGGMPPGSAQMIFDTARKQVAAQNIADEQKRQTAEIDNAKSIVGLLKDVPAGKSVTIGGQTYMSTQKGDVYHGTETNDQGKVTAWQFDPSSGTTVSTDLGYIGKATDGFTNIQTDQGWFSYNQKTGAAIPLQPSEAQTTWQSVFPNGSQSPYRSSKDPYQGQCAAFTNDLYGPNSPVHLGNDFAGKETTLSKYKVDPSQARVGDTFLMEAGDTGHVGIIAGIKPGPNGKQVVTCLESNYIPPGGGKISTTRTMNIDDPKLKMIARVPTDPSRLPPAGPDSIYTRAAMGQLTIGGKSLQEMFGINETQQKVIDNTISLVSKGTQTLDTAMQKLSRLGIDPSNYIDQLRDASAQGHLTTQQKEDIAARTKASITATQARTVNSILSPLGYKTDPSIVGYKNARANINRIYAAENQIKKLDPEFKQSNAALDLELADSYVRMATGNAVTENQVETLKNAQGWIEQGNNFLAQKQYGGFLSPEERKQIIDLSKNLLEETKKSSDEAISQLYQPALEQYGEDFKLNPDDLVRSQDPSASDISENDPLGLELDQSSSNASDSSNPLGI